MVTEIEKSVAAIERVNNDGQNAGEAMIEAGEETIPLKRWPNFDYFLVNTDDFAPHAHKGNVVEVFTCRETYEAADVVLVAGNKRLEIVPYPEAKGFQIIGKVCEVKSWPGRVVRNYQP